MKRVLYRLGLSEPEVEDVAQETLVRIWRGSASFKEQSSVSTWACRIAINQGISLIRSRRPVPADISEPHADPQVELEKRQTAAVVRSAVIELPVGLRAVIILREFEDMTYRSIAEVLEIPVGTVMSRLHEARLRLRLKLISSSSE